jgi:ABC-type Fe3+/spermidine/putrescine transport system ATPase subunit
VEFNDEIFTVSDQAVRKFNRDTNVKFMIRPEDIRIVTPERGIIKVRITSTIYKGLLNEIHCQ